MVQVFSEVRRVLTDDGTAWVNLGDSYSGAGRGDKSKDSFIGGSARASAVTKKSGETRIAQGLKPKDLCGIPWRVALALQADGWYLRQDIIWSKPNPMPESVTDRCTKSHEYIFLLSKSPRYYFDQQAIREPASYNTNERQARAKLTDKSQPDALRNGIRTPKAQKVPTGWDTSQGSHNELLGRYPRVKNNSSFDTAMQVMPDTRNKRSVWSVSPHAFPEAHFATFPPKLIEPCILAGSAVGDMVLDPFMGAGTTALVAKNLGRQAVGCELNVEYIEISARRLAQGVFDLEVPHEESNNR